MLLFMTKYNTNNFLNRAICSQNTNSKVCLHTNKKTKVLIYSFFSRKLHNRSLLNYLTVLYFNFFLTSDNNNFNLVKIVTLQYSS